MKIKVQDLMSSNVVTLQLHLTVAQAREKFVSKKIKSAPVIGPDNELLGVVSLSDLAKHKTDGSPISTIMTEKVYSIPEYEGVEIAARLMKKHKVHRLIVTKEKKVIGIISSFDLLKLVENKKFVMKNASTPRAAHKGKGKQARIS